MKKLTPSREAAAMLHVYFAEFYDRVLIVSNIAKELAKKQPIPSYDKLYSKHGPALEEMLPVIETLIQGVFVVARVNDGRGSNNITRETLRELGNELLALADSYPKAENKMRAS